jgi:hypothetical protein
MRVIEADSTPLTVDGLNYEIHWREYSPGQWVAEVTRPPFARNVGITESGPNREQITVRLIDRLRRLQEKLEKSPD